MLEFFPLTESFSTKHQREHPCSSRYIIHRYVSPLPTWMSESERDSQWTYPHPTCANNPLFSNNLILDPSHYESSIATGSLTLTLNAQRELCVLSKAGGTPLAKHDLMRVVRLAVDRVRDMTKELEDALKADEQIRVIEVR
jgi:hypothetical protein